MRITESFRNRIKHGDANDPVLRQILPVAAEDIPHPGYGPDPLGEQGNQPVPGLLHKYHGRALLVVTGACAVHCRYCFRRHFPYAESNPRADQWRGALEYLCRDTNINEVILSGGDPLTLSDERLSELVHELAAIPHLRRLRIHSRMPIVLPERIVDEMIAWLTGTRLQTVMVVHANHANELDDTAAHAIEKLRKTKISVFNQSVLLKGINDTVAALTDLSERLFEIGVIPYYLHMLDPVQGAAHFKVNDADAMRIMRGLRAKLPGYLVPRLVRETPGAESKIPLELSVP